MSVMNEYSSNISTHKYTRLNWSKFCTKVHLVDLVKIIHVFLWQAVSETPEVLWWTSPPGTSRWRGA